MRKSVNLRTLSLSRREGSSAAAGCEYRSGTAQRKSSDKAARHGKQNRAEPHGLSCKTSGHAEQITIRLAAKKKAAGRRRLADVIVTALCCIVIAAGVCGTAAVLLITGTNSGYKSVSAEPNSARAALSDAERLLLCRFICAECEGEPFVCKVSAAAVVMNRIESEYYPGCCANVIFDAGAFSCVSDGTISDKRSESEMRSAMRAIGLAEGGEDPTGGACSLGHIGEGFRGALPENITFEAGSMVFGNP